MLVARKSSALSVKDCHIEELSTIDELKHYLDEWDLLSSSCQEANVFYQSWMLIPAIKHLISSDEAKRLRFYLIWRQQEQEPELIGFFPFTYFDSYHGVPLKHIRSLYYCHCYLSTPIIKAGYESRCWQILFDWIQGSSNFKFCRLSGVSGEGAVYNEGIKAAKLANQHVVETDRYVRACMQPESSFEEYLRINVTRKVKKDIRRKFRRLSEFGSVSFEQMNLSSIVSDWIMEFMELEAKGWKGDERVAIVNDVSHMKFLREVCTAAHKRGCLHMAKLAVDENTVAMKCSFRSGSTLFAFKIAFDDQYARCSPGLLLEYELAQALCGQEDVDWVDSCMQPGDFMISRLWKGSRIIRFVNISSSGSFSKAVVSLVPLVKRLRGALTQN